MTRRLLAFVVALLLTSGLAPVRALAQSDSGEIDIVVQESGSKSPVILARVLLDGPVITNEFTGNDGKVRFTDVPDGIYRARVFARGFNPVTSTEFEVTDGKVVTVTVALALSQNGPIKTIASEVVKSTATISTTTIDSNSAQRKLSDTLADALGKLSGVTVATSSSDSDATQTVSLEGQDASQTALSLDGIPLNAPGTAGDLRGIGTDLFTRSSVSFGPQLGGLAGGVNFSTLEPTLSWQSQFSLSAGSNGKNNYAFGESGSLGKLGLAYMHTYRLNPSLIDGMQFLDTSGLDYTHEGDGQQIGSMFKMRYQVSDQQTLTGTFLHSVNGAELVCAQITGPLPCGYGPNNSYDTQFNLYGLTDNALVGDTQVQASFFGISNASTRNMLDRYVNGEAQPTGSSQTMATDGFSLNATLPSRDRHTISINAYTTNSRSSFTPLVPEAAPYVYPGQSVGYTAVTINDSIRSNTKLRFNESIGVSGATNAGATSLIGINTQWQPTVNDTVAFGYNIGGVAPHAGRFGILSDPAQLRYDCTGDVAYGNAPGDEPGASSSTSARLSYTHKIRGGLTSLSLYRQVQQDVVLPVQVNGAALSPTLFPPDYFTQVGQNFVDACGNPLGPTFGPQNVYFSTPISGVQRVYQGAQLSGYYTLGNLVVEPYYDIQVAQANSSDPRIDNPYSITISGEQLPNVPVHRAGITLDYKAPRSALEWLADANYTGSNNSQNLPAYTTVDAGVSTQLQRGSLVLAMSNIFNAYGGDFASSQWAVPYRTPNGTLIPTIARPNAPRQLSLTYSVQFGQNVHPSTGRAIGSPQEGGRGGRFRMFGVEPLPSSPPSDPFAIAQSERCQPDSVKIAQPTLDALKAYVTQIEKTKTPAGYPDAMSPANIPGLDVSYHGLKSTYALAITIRKTDELRAFFGCSAFHVADLQTAQQRNLFVQPNKGGVFFRPVLSFMPSVGLYFVRQPPQAGAESFRLYKLPATAPKAPFTLHNVGGACTTDLHATAQQALAELQAHFTSNAAAPGWTITAHTAKAGTWYSMEADDVDAVPSIISCGRVAAASSDDLSKLGWDAVRPPTLNFTPSLGIYLEAMMRFGGGANGGNANGGNANRGQGAPPPPPPNP